MNKDIKEKFLKHMQEHVREISVCEKQIQKERFDDIRGRHVLSHIHKVAGLCLTFDFKEQGSIARYVEMRLEKALKSDSSYEIKEVGVLVKNLLKACCELMDGMKSTTLENAPAAGLQSEHSFPSGLHVFVADDDPIIRKLMVKSLEDHQFVVTSVQDGVRAAEEIKKHALHLIILDQNMPHMNGTDVCEKLLEDDTTKDIPVFILSGYSAKDFKNLNDLPNIKEVIEKPFKIGDILERMKKYV